MHKFKEYKYTVLITLIILGIAFYWFQLRPAQVRKDCVANYPSAFKNSDSRYVLEVKAGYEKCLREHGLNK